MTAGQRPSYRKLYKTAAWQRLRASVLGARPLCRWCHPDGQPLTPPVVLAEHVDHIVPHRGDRHLFFDPANLQPLCAHCHNSHKQRQEARERAAGHSFAVGDDGLPLDPDHPFNRSA